MDVVEHSNKSCRRACVKRGVMLWLYMGVYGALVGTLEDLEDINALRQLGEVGFELRFGITVLSIVPSG
jgi:hypothetical protein